MMHAELRAYDLSVDNLSFKLSKFLFLLNFTETRAKAFYLMSPNPTHFIIYVVRSIKKLEEDVAVPPLVKSAALWGRSSS